MHTGIGATLREARKRRQLDLADVEAAIKIRLRYLRAMEDEEWDVLPGGPYTRGFIRTYAGHLGLDGDRLADEYRRGAAEAGGDEPTSRRIEPVPTGMPRREKRRFSGRALTAVVSLLLVGLAVAIGLLLGGGDSPAPSSSSTVDGGARGGAREQTPVASRPGISLGLTATGEVWVCLLDGDGEPLLDGEILAAGAEVGPFRSAGFSAAFGNGEVELTIDGDRAETAASSSPIGYEIRADGDLTPLEEGERPDCE